MCEKNNMCRACNKLNKMKEELQNKEKSKLKPKYTKGVDKKQREKDIESRKKSKKPLKDLFPKKSDKEAIKKGIVEKSTYTTKFNKEYPDVKYSLTGFSKKFKIPLKDLKEVEEKGI